MTESRRRGRSSQPEDLGAGLAGLVGGGPSRVGTWGAARARDVSRPTAAELARAERDVVIRRAASPQTGGSTRDSS